MSDCEVLTSQGWVPYDEDVDHMLFEGELGCSNRGCESVATEIEPMSHNTCRTLCKDCELESRGDSYHARLRSQYELDYYSGAE